MSKTIVIDEKSSGIVKNGGYWFYHEGDLITADSNLIIKVPLAVGGKVKVNGNVEARDSLDVVMGLSVSGSLSIEGTLEVGCMAEVRGSLSISGESNFYNSLTVGGKITTEDALTVQGKLRSGVKMRRVKKDQGNE